MNVGWGMDWDQAYSNVDHVANSADYPPKWQAVSHEFRSGMAASERLYGDISYGPNARNVLDLFLPEAQPRGLVVFVHGGYWLRLDKSFSSFLAAGPLAHGFAVAVPSYVLCPEARVAEITVQTGAAIARAAGMVAGPIHLAGHSVGGHLVARMASSTSPLPPQIRSRLRKILPISCLSDLRPLLRTAMNERLRLDLSEARAESPALLEPLDDMDITAWVGAAELPEFIRQNALLANAWHGFDCMIDSMEEPGKNHFTVLEGLAEPDHPLTRRLLCI
ncbi:MAG: alpha/beta hydrolase [Phyllobacterium sp.]